MKTGLVELIHANDWYDVRTLHIYRCLLYCHKTRNTDNLSSDPDALHAKKKNLYALPSFHSSSFYKFARCPKLGGCLNNLLKC